MLANEPDSRFFLFYGNRSRCEIIFREELEDLKDRYLTRLSVFHVLSREQQDVAVLNGHLDAAKAALLLRHVVPAATVDHALVCGPQPMIEALAQAMPALGVAADRVQVERFTPGPGGRNATCRCGGRAAGAVATVISEGVRA